MGLASAVLLLVSARLAEPTSSKPVLSQIIEFSVVLAGWTYWFTRPDSEFFTDLFAASITTTFTPSLSKYSSGSIHIQVLGIDRTMCLLNVALATMLLVFKVLVDKEFKIGSAPYAKYARWGLGVYYTTLNTLAALLYYRFVTTQLRPISRSGRTVLVEWRELSPEGSTLTVQSLYSRDYQSPSHLRCNLLFLASRLMSGLNRVHRGSANRVTTGY